MQDKKFKTIKKFNNGIQKTGEENIQAGGFKHKKIAIIAVVVFMLVVGYISIAALNSPKAVIALKDGFPEIVNGKQILKMDASSSGYQPNRLKVKAGIPVKWEITDKGTSGCTNAVIAKGLFNGQIDLTPGKTSVKEFIPAKPGRYEFSCWMGMISGIIDVVDLAKNES